MSVTTVEHPIARELLTTLRNAETAPYRFRDVLDRLSTLICVEATRGTQLRQVSITSPIGPATGYEVGHVPVLLPVLRAGLGMLPAAQRLLPEAPVAFVGMSRDELTKEPRRYLASMPDEVRGGDVLVLDPMIATGGSVVAVLDLLAEAGAGRIVVAAVIAAPEGLERLEAAHPGTEVITAAIDVRLDERAFIVPGLGDAGDRQFGAPGASARG